jgi:hypothetical protein
MKPSRKQHLLTALLALMLMGLTACAMLQPDSQVQEVSSQPVTPVTDESTEVFNCTGNDPHPIGQNIATTYEVTYQQVMTWFCSGYSFENILVALETSQAVDIPADTLLEMLLEKEWEEIWVEVGFTDDQ